MRYSLFCRAIAPFLGLALWGVSAHAEESQCTFKWYLYRIQASVSGTTSLTEDIGLSSAVVTPTPSTPAINNAGVDAPSPHADPAGARMRLTFFTQADLKIGEQNFHLDEKGVRWNDGPFPTECRDVARRNMPKVAWLTEVESSMSIAESADMQYMEKIGEDVYRLRRLPKIQGLTLSWKPTDVENSRIHFNPLQIKLESVQAREPIEGVALEVGKPIFSTDEAICDLRLTLNRPYGLLIDSPRGTLLLTFLVCELGEKLEMRRLGLLIGDEDEDPLVGDCEEDEKSGGAPDGQVK